MNQHDGIKLLFGPYKAPSLSRGDRVFCLARDCDVVITSWSDALIPWPRCRALESRGGSGILLDEELARAVQHEGARAVCRWWGVTEGVVWRWRAALGVTKLNNEGTQRLIHAAAKKGAEAVQRKHFTDEEREAKRRLNRELNVEPGSHGPLWTAEQLALLGTMPDEEVAARTGRTRAGARVMRTRLGIPNLGIPNPQPARPQTRSSAGRTSDRR
jgi:hypothetical protein